MKAVLIPAGGAMTQADTADDTAAQAELIGCTWIETIRTTIDGLYLVVDDEGRWNGQPVNLQASILAERTIVGDALLIGVDIDGETVDVPQDEINGLLAAGVPV